MFCILFISSKNLKVQDSFDLVTSWKWMRHTILDISLVKWGAKMFINVYEFTYLFILKGLVQVNDNGKSLRCKHAGFQYYSSFTDTLPYIMTLN